MNPTQPIADAIVWRDNHPRKQWPLLALYALLVALAGSGAGFLALRVWRAW